MDARDQAATEAGPSGGSDSWRGPQPLVRLGEPHFSKPLRQVSLFSALLRQVDHMPIRSASPEAWLQAIQGLMNKGLVKADEVEWTGLREWLGLQESKVTKEAVTGFLAANGVQVEVVALGSPANSVALKALEDAGFTVEEDDFGGALVMDRDGYQIGIDELPPSLQGHAEALNIDAEGSPAKYAKYALAGGANYREILLTLPAQSLEDARREIINGDERFSGQSFSDLSLNLQRKIDEVAKTTPSKSEHQSKHWAQPNVLAHIRMDERVDEQGKRVLFVHEIQSDWAQDGRRKGFQMGTRFEVAEPSPGRFVIVESANGSAISLPGNVVAFSSREGAQEAIDDGRADRGYGSTEGVPNGPFVTSTKKWVALAVKEVVRQAVEGDFDRVAFASGEQSADMLQMKSVIANMKVTRTLQGHFAVQAKDADGKTIIDDVRTYRQLLNDIGSAWTEKLDTELKTQGEQQSYENMDVRMGVAGLNAFYGQIVPAVAADVIRRLGGELGRVSLPDGDINARLERLAQSHHASGFDSLSDRAQSRIRSEAAAQERTLHQIGFEVTAAMKEQVRLQGVPLFSHAEKAAPVRSEEGDVERVRKAVASLLGPKAVKHNEEMGRLVVLQASDLPATARPLVGTHAMASFASDPAFQAHLAEIRAAQARAIASIGLVDEVAIVRHEDSESRWVMILADASSQGKWRTQSFDKNGFGGHMTFNTKELAIENAAGMGFTVRDDGALDRIQDTHEFQRGLYAADLILQYNMGQIDMAQFNAAIVRFDETNKVLASIVRSGAQAFVSAGGNSIYLVADRIARGDETAVYLHEVTHRWGRAMMDPREWNHLVGRAKAWATRDVGSLERTIHDRARGRVIHAGTPSTFRDEEFFAYAVEEAVSLGVRPSAQAHAESAEAWLDAVVSGLRNSILKATPADGGDPLKGLGAQQLVDLAYAMAQLDSPERVHRVWQQLDAFERERFDLLMQRQGHPCWYSRLAQVLSVEPFDQASGASWTSAVGRLVSAGRLDLSEVDASGLLQWLSDQGGLVSKEQVSRYLRGNGLQPLLTELIEEASENAAKAFLQAVKGAEPALAEGLQIDITARRGVATLNNLYVQPESRGLGVATRFMQRLTELADEHGMPVELEVGSGADDEDGPDLPAFYAQWGFAWRDGFMRREPGSDSADQQLDHIESQEALLPPEEGALASFAGEKALGLDAHALASARLMLAAGDDAEQVRQITGWFLGPDQKWRFEIDDSRASARFGGSWEQAIMRAYEDGVQRTGSQSYTTRVSDVIDHPALFAAYPRLADIEVQMMPTRISSRGRLSDDGENLVLQMDEHLDQAGWMSVIKHELQHAIQTVEGFASGGSSQLMSWASSRMRPHLLEETRRTIEQAEPATYEAYWGAQRTPEGEASYAEYLKTWESQEFRHRMCVAAQEGAASKVYRRLYGEVEARNVQARAAMNALQRRLTSPASTEDVARDQVVIVYNGHELEDAGPVDNARPRTIVELRTLLMSMGVDHSLWEGRENGRMELSSIIVPPELRGQGIGSRAMLAITRYADENKLLLALTPSTDLGGSSVKRLQSFYRRFGLVPNRGRNKDFTTSESMIRRPRSLDVFDLSLPLDGNQVRETRVGHSRVVIDANANTGQITLASLRTPAARRGEGSARAALKLLLEQADRQGVRLTLGCSALDGKTDQGRLHAFYRSMGFVDTGRKINAVGDPEMAREPNPVALPQDRIEPSTEKANDIRQPLATVVTREGWGEYVARVGDVVVGRALPWVDGQGRFCMQNVAVSPLWRRRGVATALYQQVEADAGRALTPAISLSDEGFEFWKSFRPEAVATDLRHQRDELMGTKVMKKGRLATVVSVGSGTVTARYDDAVERANSETFLLAREMAGAIVSARDHLHEQALAARLFAPGPQGVPGIVFHVTPAANKAAILAEGITPRLGDRSSVAGEAVSGSFHFTSPGALLDAMDGWMVDAFDQEEPLAVFAVNAGAGDWSQAPQAAYEATCSSVIPPGALELVSSDLGSLTALDARQALLEAAQRLQQRVEASQRRSLNLAAWAQGTAVKSEDGQPLVVFHSTVAEFNQFKRARKDVGMHFGTAGQAADRFRRKIEADPYGPSLRGVTHATMPVYLRILRPLRLPDAGRWTRENLVAILPDEFTLEEKVAAKTEAQVKRLIQAHGYDGIVYRNENEVDGLHQLRAAKIEAWSALYASQGENATKDKDHPDYVAWDRARQAYIDFRKTHGVDSWIAFEPKQIKSAIGNDGRFSLSSADLRFSVARAFHGTPHRFERFSTDKVGSGEGAQTFGWGLYFAGKREVAEHYRKTISGDGFLVAGGAVFDPGSLQHLNVRVLAREGDLDRAIAKALEIAESDSPVALLARDDLRLLQAIKERGGITKNPGLLYEVEIPEEGRMLLWDKPLSAHPETVREALKRMALAIPARWETGAMGERRFVDLGRQIVLAMDDDAITGEALYNRLVLGFSSDQFAGDMMGDKAASEMLQAHGIPGIKYLDGVSRGQGEGSYNYVVFSGDDVSIVDVKDQAKAAALRSWFGDSMMVDADGKPQIFYHGTGNGGTTEFSRKAWRTAYGHFFTDDKEAADGYSRGANPQTYSVYLKVANPLRLDSIVEDGYGIPIALREWIAETFDAQYGPPGDQFQAWLDRGDLYSMDMGRSQDSLMRWAEENGFDAVVFFDSKIGGGVARSFVVFEPSQIKSATDNNGEFDASNPDIRFSFSGADDARAPRTTQDLTKTAAFGKWFGASKVLDAVGQPLVMYHGTKADFTTYDIRKFGASDEGLAGKGFYFTSNPEEASGYALNEQFGAGGVPNVQAVYVALNNPLVVTQGVLPDGRKLYDLHRGIGINSKGGAAVRNLAEDAGHDGVMWVSSDRAVRHAVAFYPEQIKSATGNIGTFDPENSDIRFSFAGARAQAAGDTRAPLTPQDLTATESFKKWFAGSKMLDEQGQPLVMYHGTNQDFTAFDRDMSREGDGIIFATPSQSMASAFAKYRSTWNGANVMPVYVRAEKVLEVQGDGRMIRDVERDARIDGMRYGEDLRAFAKREGYDAIMFRDVREDVGPDILPIASVYALLPTAKIKSAVGNVGTFDPENSDIRFSFAGARAQVAGDTRAPLAPQDLTKTEGFGKWFGASKVVDAVGKPLVVYHGTQSEFTEFSAEFIGNGNGSGDWGDGFYFTDREDAAAQYAKGENGKVMPVYLAMRNPATNAVLMSKKVQEALDDDMGFESVDEVLSGMGYDGIAFTHKGGGTEYVVFRPEQIKSATNNDGEFDPGNADIRFSFAGPKSQLQPLRPLSEAVSRVESGQPAELVRRETGWFQGHDGQWRFELDDHGASLKNLRLDGGRGLRATSLSEILDHPALFAAYPELRHLDVQIIIAPEKAAEGRYQRRSPGDEKYFGLSPEVYAQGPDEATALSILLHEVQHVIQDIEGFAPGGNPQQFTTTSVLPFEVLNASLAVQSFAAKTGVTVHEVQANPPRHLRDISYRAWQLSTEMSTPQLEQAYDQALLAHRPLESYRRLAGEVEARNTQVRRGWTEEQRLAVSPHITEDVDAADVIVPEATVPPLVQLHVSAEVATEDAGQELVANRRNRVDRGLRWDDLVAMDPALRVREARKDRIIPKPDYQALADTVIHPMVAYVVKQAYDSISVQPNVRGAATDQDLQRYILAANRYMSGVMNWANDQDKTRAWMSSLGTQAGAYLGASRGELTSIQSLAQRPAQSLLQTVYGDNWRAFRDEVIVLGGNKALGALQPAMSDAVKAMKEIDKGWPGKLEAWQKRGMRVIEPQTVEVDVHVQAERGDRDAYAYVMLTVRDGKQRVEVASLRIEGAVNSEDPRVTAYVEQELPKLQGKHLLVDKLRRFKGAFDSRDAAVSHARDLTKVVRGGSTVDERGVSVEQAERVGVARRPEDRPVSSQDLIDTFGFRGVNFGNWMKGDANAAERQLHLNHAYDSFMDLAEVLGVEQRAMSLGGTLGLAIGAQGNGGTYAAHFMPGVNEINITRTSGAGSLAHEWGHALDHHYARIAGLERQESPFLSEYIRSISSSPSSAALRDEVRAAYLELMHHISKRPLTAEELAKTADQRVEKSRRNINSWLASIRRDFERTATEALPNFDALAQRIRQDDFGACGERDEFFPVITEIRQQYKLATGHIYSIQDSRALQNNLSYLRRLLDSAEATQAHSAQQMVSSHYVALANGLDKDKGGKPYWATPRELFARAFDAWVSDQMVLRETRNTYLSHADREGATVPMGEERTRINEAFSTLIQSVRTRQDDDGQVTLYSMPGKSSRSNERYVAAQVGSGDVSPQFQYLAAEQALTRYQGCVQRFPKTVAAHLAMDGHFFEQIRLHGLDAHERSIEDLMGALALVQHPDAAERQSELSDVYRQAMDEELGELGTPDRQQWQSVLEDLGALRNASGDSIVKLHHRFAQGSVAGNAVLSPLGDQKDGEIPEGGMVCQDAAML